MIRIIIQDIPFGMEEGTKEVCRIDLKGVGKGLKLSYDAVLIVNDTPHRFPLVVKQFDRRQGILELVHQAFDGLNTKRPKRLFKWKK